MIKEIKIVIRHMLLIASVYILLVLVVYIPFFMEHGYKKGVNLFWAEAGIGLFFPIPVAAIYLYILSFVIAKLNSRPLGFTAILISIVVGSITMFVSVFDHFPSDLVLVTAAITLGSYIYYRLTRSE